jgi:hypothetical protein
MITSQKIDLTSSEMALLWVTYMNDSMSVCVSKHFLQIVEDQEIRPIIENALDLSQKHVQKITDIFNQENHAVPDGFSDSDVILSAPRLFSDPFMLLYVHNTAKERLNIYGLALANAARSDIREFFSELIASTTKLYNTSADVMLSKGLYLRSPYLPRMEKVEYIQHQSFLTGWFGERRPLNAIEISLMFFNMERNILGNALLTGFSQVAKSQEVRKYMVRGIDISRKHMEIFSSLMSEDNLSMPNIWNLGVTASTIPPFSDKLMMFHTAGLIGSSIGYYATGVGTSLRRDLAVQFTRLSAEIGAYAEDGANLMIENGWMEQPPTAPDHKELALGKK